MRDSCAAACLILYESERNYSGQRKFLWLTNMQKEQVAARAYAAQGTVASFTVAIHCVCTATPATIPDHDAFELEG